MVFYKFNINNIKFYKSSTLAVKCRWTYKTVCNW